MTDLVQALFLKRRLFPPKEDLPIPTKTFDNLRSPVDLALKAPCSHRLGSGVGQSLQSRLGASPAGGLGSHLGSKWTSRCCDP